MVPNGQEMAQELQFLMYGLILCGSVLLVVSVGWAVMLVKLWSNKNTEAVWERKYTSKTSQTGQKKS